MSLQPRDPAKELSVVSLAHCQALLSNPSFAWFTEKCIGAKMDEQDVILHDVKKTPDERTKALERWDELNKVRGWVKDQRGMHQRSLGQAVTQD